MSSLVLIGEPIAKQRPRMNRKTGMVYTPTASRKYEEAIGWACKGLAKMESGRPVKVTLDFYCTPTTRQRTPDLDNLIKAALDGLEKGGVLANDVDVVAIEAYRWEDYKCKTEVTLAYI